MKFQHISIILSALLIFLFGCVLTDQYNTPITNSDRLGTTDISVLKYSAPVNYTCKELPGPNPCYCMVCQNHTSWIARLLPFLKPFFDTSLESGECRFDHCNATEFFTEIYNKNDDLQTRTFMFGYGPSFASTDKANLYCNYSLQLATKWMRGNGTAPRVPLPSRAKCWLQRNILPVFMYYTNGTALNPARALQIAHAFDNEDVGPAILTTEVNFDSNDPAQIDDVRQQIRAYNQCDKCLTVLAVKSGDASALAKIFRDPVSPSGFTPEYDMVDMVGFGFRANDYPDCSIARVLGPNLKFSREILRNYSKPTIWLYAGASEGNSSDGSCQWDAQGVHMFYQNIYGISQSLATSGVVGASFYEMTDHTGPLGCNGEQGCDFGVMLANGSQKHPELNTWSNLCQGYATQPFRPPLVFSRNALGAVCSNLMQSQTLAGTLPEEINTNLALNYSDVRPIDKIKKLGCGEACPCESSMKEPGKLDSTGARLDSTDADHNGVPDHCELYPQIEEIADDKDFSSTYFRAVAEIESSFNKFAISCKPKADSPCNKAGLTPEEICTLAGEDPANCHKSCTYGVCAFGLAQCIEYPGQYYLQNNKPLPPEIKDCGGYNYNPFNPANSACCGINKMREYTDSGSNFINANWGVLGKGNPCSGGIEPDDQCWAGQYLGSQMYFGGPSVGQSTLASFLSQRDANGTCTGEENYISYIRGLNNGGYGAKIISVYRDAVDKCDSDCPK